VLRALALVVLVLAGLAWAALDRSLDAPDRTRAYAETGLPERPSPWTVLRARVAGPPSVAIQIGHLHAEDHPDELAALRVSTGASVAGLHEVDVNRAVAEALSQRLTRAGVRVTMVPATVPPGLRADVLLSVHADASLEPERRGYKSAHALPARNRREPLLKAAVDAAYLHASGLPDDHDNVTGAMLDYYAFADGRLRHAAHRGTAGLIVELGYLSHPQDRAWLADPDRVAAALADGLVRYLAGLDRWHPALAPRIP
jgi:N-acetylmuramoyl-L-alanine amidase